MTIPLTFEINSPQATNLGIATGVYADDGDDTSTGTGNLDSYGLSAGDNEVSLSTTLPDKMKKGQYELIAQLWQPNKIAQGEVAAESTCGTFKVL